jgi:HPt (histidine-containing phosphotransfer) domain-containing protein
MAGIEEAIAADDAAALADNAHTMKGALSVFGVEPARSTAEQLEMAGRDKRLQNADELYQRLGREIAAAEHGLEAFLAEVS